MTATISSRKSKSQDVSQFIPAARRAREQDLNELAQPPSEILRVDSQNTHTKGVLLDQQSVLAGTNFSHSELRQQMILKNHPLIAAFRNSTIHAHSRGVGQMNLRYTNLKRLVNDLVRSEHEDLTADLAIRVAVRNNLDERNALIVSIAALIHDDGHPPTHHPGANIISHFLPGLDGKGFCHEAMTRALVEGRANRYLLSLVPGFDEKKFDSACSKGAGEPYLLNLVPGYNSIEFNQARLSGAEDTYLTRLIGFSPLKLLRTPENTTYKDLLANPELNIHNITPQEIVAALNGKTAFGKLVKELDRLTYLMHDVCGSPGFKPEFVKLTREIVNQIVDNIIVEPNGFYLRDDGAILERSAPFLALVVRHHLYADVSLSPAATLFSAEFDRQICSLVKAGELSITDFVRMSEGEVLARMNKQVRQRFELGIDNFFEPLCAYPVSALELDDDQALQELSQLIADELDQNSSLQLPHGSFHVCFTQEIHKPKKTTYVTRIFEGQGDARTTIEYNRAFRFPPECAIADEALPQPLNALPQPHNDRVFFVAIDRQAPADSGISQSEWLMRIKLAKLRLRRVIEDFVKPSVKDTAHITDLFSRVCHPHIFSHGSLAQAPSTLDEINATSTPTRQSVRQSNSDVDLSIEAASSHAL